MLALEISLSVLAVILGAVIVTAPFWIARQAQIFAKINFIITSLQENSFKMVEDFEKPIRPLISKEGYYISLTGAVISEKADTVTKTANPPAPIHPMDRRLPGNLKWLGWPYRMKPKRWHFQYTGLRQGVLAPGQSIEYGLVKIAKQDDLDDLLIFRDEWLDFILLKDDIYVLTFQNLEDKDQIPVSFIVLFTARVVNPIKAAYAPEQWLEQTSNFLRSPIQDYIGSHTFTELVSRQQRTVGESAEILGYDSTEKDANGAAIPVGKFILDTWGVQIVHLNIVRLKTAGKRGEAYETAAANKYLKHQEAEGIRELAQAESDKLAKIAEGEKRQFELRGEGQASYIASVANAIKDGGDAAQFGLTMETYQKLGEQGNATTIISDKPSQILVNSAGQASKIIKPERSEV